MNRRRVTARAGIAALLVAGILTCLLPAPAVAAEPRGPFFGLQGWTTFPTAQDFAMMKRGGVGTLRAIFDAGGIPASPDDARWAAYDALMASAARQGMQVLPVLNGSSSGLHPFRPPRTRAQRIAWADFAGSVAARYGRGGTFWRAHPELPADPLRAYQIWNEPNLRVFWRPAVDAAGYLRLVRLTRARLLAADPKASIVLGGLPDSRLGTPMLDFVREIYAQPGARSLFDVVALHPYSAGPAGVLEKLDAVRALMDRRGDRATPIWITEIGWSTGGPRSPFRTSRAGQAAKITRTLGELIAARARLRLERVMLIALQDRAYLPAEAPWWGPRVGLFDRAGNPKPAWAAFVRFTGGRSGGRLPRVDSAGR
jgi:hypothetical protein